MNARIPVLAFASLISLSLALAQGEASLDPEMQAVLEAQAALGGKPIPSLAPSEARRQPALAAAVEQLLAQEGDKPADMTSAVESATVQAGANAIPVRIYTPKGEGPFPVILYIHGGGWVVGDLQSSDATPRALCGAVNAIVVSTHYRQAPEFKYPAAHVDVLSVYHWLLRNEGQRNYDVTRLAVVGEDAGGNMAASLSLRARELGLPLPVHQVLIYPIVDLVRRDTLSYAEHAEARPLGAAQMNWLASQILAKPEHANDPRLSLRLAGPALRGLPPTTLILAQIDPLRSEGEALAQDLKAQGVPVQLRTFPGMAHDFFGLADVVDRAREAQQFVGTNLTIAFKSGGSPYLRRLESSLTDGLVRHIKDLPNYVDEMDAKPAGK